MKRSKRVLTTVIAVVLIFCLTAIPVSAASGSASTIFLVGPYRGDCSLAFMDTKATAALTVTEVGTIDLLPHVSFRLEGGAVSDDDKEYFLNADGDISFGNSGSCSNTRTVDKVGETFISAHCEYFFNSFPQKSLKINQTEN